MSIIHSLFSLSGLPDFEFSLLDLIKWEDENGKEREFRIYSEIGHKWREIATRLGLKPGVISSIEDEHRQISSRIAAVLQKWSENANSLRNAKDYPKSWEGLINLLKDVQLGEVAADLKKALSSHTHKKAV